MDAFELLKNDHKKVSQLFEEIESASGQAKSRLFKRLKSELDLHTHIEESYLYPTLENKKEAREITLEAYEEHKVVKDLLAELSNGKAPNDEWDAKLKVLKENVDHHVEEEEGELFDKAEDALSDEEIERLGNQMEAEKVRKQGGKAQSQNGQRAKRNSAKTGEGGPGVLKRLANLVGLGGSSSKARKTSRKSSDARSSSRRKASKGATKTAAGKSAGKSSSSNKSRAAGKAAKGRASSKKSSGKKAPSRRTGARKSRGR